MSVKNESEVLNPPSASVSLAAGAGVGFLSGLVGVGGGIFLSPLLILKRWASAKQTAAVSAFFIFVNSVAGIAGALISDQAKIDGDLLIQFAAAVLIGGFLGTRLGANHASDQMIRRLLVVVLVVAAVRRLLGFVGL